MYTFNQSCIVLAWKLTRGEFPTTRSFRWQLSYDKQKIKTNTCRLMRGDMNIKDFLLVCSCTLNNYQDYLMSSAIQMFYANPNINYVRNVEMTNSGSETNFQNSSESSINRNTTAREQFNGIRNPDNGARMISIVEDYFLYIQQQLQQAQQIPLHLQQLLLQLQLQIQLLLHIQQPSLQPQQDERIYINGIRDNHEDEQGHIVDISDSDRNEDPSNSSDSDDQSTHGFCMVCHTKKSHYKFIILPCGHSWICRKCRDQELSNCPYCRRLVKSFVRILETSI